MSGEDSRSDGLAAAARYDLHMGGQHGKRLLHASAFLIMGALLTLVVSWACCMRAYVNLPASFTSRRPTSEELAWWRGAAPPGLEEPNEAWPSAAFGCRSVRLNGPGPIVTRANGEQIELTSASYYIDAGWPLRAMHGEWFSVPNASTGGWDDRFQGAISQRDSALAQYFPKRSYGLPLVPMLPGFAISALVYASMFWVLFAIPGAFKRWSRIRRGRCANCGYPVGMSDRCSECGTPVAGRAVSA